MSDAEIPWAIQIALRVEKTDPPTDIEACEAAACACVGLLVEAERRATSGHAGKVDEVGTSSHGSAREDADASAAGDEFDGATGPERRWLDAVDAWRGVASPSPPAPPP